MSLIKQEEQVVYVEPNAMDDITLYNTKNNLCNLLSAN